MVCNWFTLLCLCSTNVILMPAKTLKQFFSNCRKPPIAIIACAISQEVFKLSVCVLCYILLEMNQNHKNICNSMQVMIVSIISIISCFNILSAKNLVLPQSP